jgi:hypothetical protein
MDSVMNEKRNSFDKPRINKEKLAVTDDRNDSKIQLLFEIKIFSKNISARILRNVLNPICSKAVEFFPWILPNLRVNGTLPYS